MFIGTIRMLFLLLFSIIGNIGSNVIMPGTRKNNTQFRSFVDCRLTSYYLEYTTLHIILEGNCYNLSLAYCLDYPYNREIKKITSFSLEKYLPSGTIFTVILYDTVKMLEKSRTEIITTIPNWESVFEISITDEGFVFQLVYYYYIEYDVTVNYTVNKIFYKNVEYSMQVYASSLLHSDEKHTYQTDPEGKFVINLIISIRHSICYGINAPLNCKINVDIPVYINTTEGKNVEIISYRTYNKLIYIHYRSVNVLFNEKQTYKVLFVERFKKHCATEDMKKLLIENTSGKCFHRVVIFRKNSKNTNNLIELHLLKDLLYPNADFKFICFSALINVCASKMCYYSDIIHDICIDLNLNRKCLIICSVLYVFSGIFMILNWVNMSYCIFKAHKTMNLLKKRAVKLKMQYKADVQIQKSVNELSTRRKKMIVDLDIGYNKLYKHARHFCPIDDEYVGTDEDSVLIQSVNNTDANYAANYIIENDYIMFEDFAIYYMKLQYNNFVNFKLLINFIRKNDIPIRNYFVPPVESSSMLSLFSIPSLKHRVKLELTTYSSTDFINAAHISGTEGPGDYIISVCSCQSNTYNFLRMVIDYKVKSAVNFCEYAKCVSGKCKLMAYLRNPIIQFAKYVINDVVVFCEKYYKDQKVALVNMMITRPKPMTGTIQSVELRHFFVKNLDIKNDLAQYETILTLRKLVRSWHGTSKYPILLSTADGTGAGVIFAAFDYNLNRFDRGFESFSVTEFVIEARHAKTNALTDPQELFAIFQLLYQTISIAPY